MCRACHTPNNEDRVAGYGRCGGEERDVSSALMISPGVIMCDELGQRASKRVSRNRISLERRSCLTERTHIFSEGIQIRAAARMFQTPNTVESDVIFRRVRIALADREQERQPRS